MRQPEYNVETIAAMSAEQSLRNFCRQIEFEHVEQRRPATYKGFNIGRLWPGMPFMTRCHVVTTKGRKVQVRDKDETVIAILPMRQGLARELYLIAANLLDQTEELEGRFA